MAYQGVRASEPGRTIDRRNASAERARAAQGQAPRQHNAPRVRTQTRVPSTGHAVPTPDSVPAHIDFTIVFVPHVPPSIPGGHQGYPARQFRWPAATLAKLVDVLHEVGLVFTVSLPASGSVWRALVVRHVSDSAN
ncbi:hypothetical protein ACG7TL_002969 [Trametes sanguinea]